MLALMSSEGLACLLFESGAQFFITGRLMEEEDQKIKIFGFNTGAWKLLHHEHDSYGRSFYS